jgi:hypothetical protein
MNGCSQSKIRSNQSRTMAKFHYILLILKAFQGTIDRIPKKKLGSLIDEGESF